MIVIFFYGALFIFIVAAIVHHRYYVTPTLVLLKTDDFEARVAALSYLPAILSQLTSNFAAIVFFVVAGISSVLGLTLLSSSPTAGSVIIYLSAFVSMSFTLGIFSRDHSLSTLPLVHTTASLYRAKHPAVERDDAYTVSAATKADWAAGPEGALFLRLCLCFSSNSVKLPRDFRLGFKKHSTLHMTGTVKAGSFWNLFF